MLLQIPSAVFLGVLTRLVLFGSPLWIVVAFALCALNGKFTLRLLLAFVTCECVAFASLVWVFRNLVD
jgi:hypothetical protein